MKNSTYICKTCGKESKKSHQKMNIYCSNTCSAEGKLLDSIKKLNQGLLFERKTIAKALAKINGYKCEICSITEYNNKSIILQVDHKDGNAGNNFSDNLRLLCPNCHSQTSSFGGRNKGNGRAKRGFPLR